MTLALHLTPIHSDTILSPTPARGRAGRRVQEPAGPGRGPARADEARELPPRHRVGAPAAPSPGRRPPIPAGVRARRSRLPGPRGESSCNFAGEAAAGLGLGAGLRPAVRRQAAGAPTLRPVRPPGGRGRGRGPDYAHLPWNQSLQASHSIMKRVTS